MNISSLNSQQHVNATLLNKSNAQQAHVPSQNSANTLEPAIIQKSEAALRQQSLVAKLMGDSDVRPEVVEQNRALASDPSFPSRNDLTELAKALLRPIV